jgi:hypothetical protein
MNQEIKKLWVADLRANADKQGKGYLNINNEKFCCLGRLCEIAIQNGIDVRKEQSTGYAKRKGAFSYDGWTGVIPDKVKEWANIQNDILQYNSQFLSLDALNDGDDSDKDFEKRNPLTFLEIADLIEKQL